jgi:hypothetical protein
VLQYTNQERFARDKHPSLSGPFVSYIENIVLQIQYQFSAANIRLGWKQMAVAKALAYFDTATIMTVVLEYRPQGIMKK